MPRAAKKTQAKKAPAKKQSARRTRQKAASKIKPHNRVAKFQNLRRLGCFEEVHDRIIRGWPISEVARFIQDDQQEYGNVTRASLITILHDYRKSLPPGDLVRNTVPGAVMNAVQQVEEGVDEISALEKLYRLQMQRIGIDHEIEKNAKKLFPSMTQEIKAAKDILGELAQLKMDLGLADRHLGKLDVESTATEVSLRYGNENVAKVLNNPESRQRLLGLVRGVVQLEKAKREEDGQDGETFLVDSDGLELNMDDEELAGFAPAPEEEDESDGDQVE
jgi:hypothetical protein